MHENAFLTLHYVIQWLMRYERLLLKVFEHGRSKIRVVKHCLLGNVMVSWSIKCKDNTSHDERFHFWTMYSGGQYTEEVYCTLVSSYPDIVWAYVGQSAWSRNVLNKLPFISYPYGDYGSLLSILWWTFFPSCRITLVVS